MYDVIRTFHADYIIFDLLFLFVFLGLLVRYKKWIPLAAFFLGGGVINFCVDWGYWLHSGIREISLPDGFLGLPRTWGVLIFFLWFSLSYGVEYAWTFLMFERGPGRLKWTALVLGGWLFVGTMSQVVPLWNAEIVTIRHMAMLRIVRVAIVAVGYGALFLLKYRWRTICYLFAVGFGIHFMMEASLLVTGIRPGSLLILTENALIEFNMGVPVFFLIYDRVLRKKCWTEPGGMVDVHRDRGSLR